MFKKILIVLLGIFLCIGFIFSQETPQKLKAKFQVMAVTQGKPDLKPSVWVNCCGDNKNPCEKTLEDKGYFLVTDFTIHVFNAGTEASSSANGKVEFFDVFTNSNKTFNFRVDPTPARQFGKVNPGQIIGSFLVKKSEGIKVSVTFSVPGSLGSKTNTSVQQSCSELY